MSDEAATKAAPPAPLPTSGEPLARGAALRRELAIKLPVPDLARDAGGALVVDTQALDLGADEVAGPLHDNVDIPSIPTGGAAPR